MRQVRLWETEDSVIASSCLEGQAANRLKKLHGQNFASNYLAYWCSLEVHTNTSWSARLSRRVLWQVMWLSQHLTQPDPECFTCPMKCLKTLPQACLSWNNNNPRKNVVANFLKFPHPGLVTSRQRAIHTMYLNDQGMWPITWQLQSCNYLWYCLLRSTIWFLL